MAEFMAEVAAYWGDDQLDADLVPEVPWAAASTSEAAMLQVLEQMHPITTGKDAGRHAALAQALAASRDTLAAFFDGEQSVLVMADDGKVRNNRLNLLSVLRNQAFVLADFSRIAG